MSKSRLPRSKRHHYKRSHDHHSEPRLDSGCGPGLHPGHADDHAHVRDLDDLDDGPAERGYCQQCWNSNRFPWCSSFVCLRAGVGVCCVIRRRRVDVVGVVGEKGKEKEVEVRNQV